jgi:hypothetical protein
MVFRSAPVETAVDPCSERIRRSADADLEMTDESNVPCFESAPAHSSSHVSNGR